jgi:polysaccharide pyruvyl transferase WcaK-like protein
VPVHILIEPLGDHSLNLGDVAMRQVAVARLRGLWPDARITMLTKDAEELRRAVPDVEPLDVHLQREWFRELTPDAVRARLPAGVASRVTSAERGLRTRWPRAVGAAVASKRRLLRQRADDGASFLETVLGSDIVFVSGAGAINDHFGGRLTRAFDLLSLAYRHGIVTTMMGQGIGPLTDEAVTTAARRVLPHVRLIGLREERTGRPLLEQLGVPAENVVVTGDDAVELAYDSRSDAPGAALGLNVRVAGYVQLTRDDLSAIAERIGAFAVGRKPGLVAVPTSRHAGEADLAVVRSVAAEVGMPLVAAEELETPAAAVRQIARCRAIVTGSYHAAVFALGQGIPAVCLAPNEYYVQKFDGLKGLFGAGCFVVHRGYAGLDAALSDAWEQADELRAPLLTAAAAQVRAGRDAYARIPSFVRAR